MKKSLGVLLASLVPGLGLALLGLVRRGILVFATFAALIGLYLFAPWEYVNTFSCGLAFMLWVGQVIIALQTVQRAARTEEGLTSKARPAQLLPAPPPGASSAEKLQHQARETVRAQLEPGEILQNAFFGQSPTSLASHAVFGPLAWLRTHRYFVGLLESDLIFVERDLVGKTAEVWRIPLEQVDSAELRSGRMQDRLTVEFREREKMALQIPRAYRPETTGIKEKLSMRNTIGEVDLPPVLLKAERGPSTPIGRLHVLAKRSRCA